MDEGTMRREPDRRTLLLLIVPIIGFIIASNVGDALAPSLVDSHPLWLAALNSRNRNLILITNQVDALGFYLVASLRLLASDPLFFLLGYWYGDAAIQWMEKRTRSFGGVLRQYEQWFRKAAYPVVFVLPNQWVCLFAGAAGMSVAGFFAANVAGTIVRLYLIRRLGETFEAPIDDVLGFIGDYRGPLLLLSVGLVVVFGLLEMRKGEGEVEALLHLEEDLQAAADDLGPDDDGAPATDRS